MKLWVKHLSTTSSLPHARLSGETQGIWRRHVKTPTPGGIPNVNILLILHYELYWRRYIQSIQLVLGINIIIVLHMKLILSPQRSSSFITALPGPSLNLASPQVIPLDQNCISGYSTLWEIYESCNNNIIHTTCIWEIFRNNFPWSPTKTKTKNFEASILAAWIFK